MLKLILCRGVPMAHFLKNWATLQELDLVAMRLC